MKKSLIIIGIIVLLVGGWKLFAYSTDPISMVVKFKQDTREQDAISTIEKYQSGIKEREHFEYDNPFFSWLYPFSNPDRRSIAIETVRIRARKLGEKIQSESNVEKVIILKSSYQEARNYKEFLESLNPRLTQ